MAGICLYSGLFYLLSSFQREITTSKPMPNNFSNSYNYKHGFHFFKQTRKFSNRKEEKILTIYFSELVLQEKKEL
jgi:hypothetical protein